MRLNKADVLEDVEDVQFSKYLRHNTVKYKKVNDDRIYIRFHLIDIIVFYPDYIILNSGRFMTKTTKNRLNEYQNICIIKQINSQWFVTTAKGTIPFFDGMKISNNGLFTN